jgi:glutamate/tyrosine decarboxylase-like PLP-dependent enzyme
MTTDRRRRLLLDAAERGIRYLDGIESRHVYPRDEAVQRLEAALSDAFPQHASDPGDVLAFIDAYGSPATVASAGSRYFGFVTGGALPASVAANWLAGAWDQNCFGFVSSPAVALFEEAALRWMKDALRLPSEADGAFVTGATMANFTCLAAARHAVLERTGWDVERQGLFGAPETTVIVGDEAHASLLKVIALLGLGRDRVVRVPVDAQGRMLSDRLPDVTGPAILCLQAGNVNSGAFDPAAIIVPRMRDRGVWVHIDGAFGLWARASERLAPLARGFELADSWATDAHKWLNVPYDCGAAFVRSKAALRAAMSISGSYLLLGGRRDAIDSTPESSRRARAVEAWAALKSLGRSGIAELIERNCTQALWLAEQLAAAGCRVLNDVVLNQVVVSFGDDEFNRRVITALQHSGKCWCGSTSWRGRHAMRLSISSWATKQADVERALEAILSARQNAGRCPAVPTI